MPYIPFYHINPVDVLHPHIGISFIQEVFAKAVKRCTISNTTHEKDTLKKVTKLTDSTEMRMIIRIYKNISTNENTNLSGIYIIIVII